ncbi:response regulator [Carboxylicivirga sp. N1Y90]|uniref:response regulator n=1 Tax=Carboxylicivirga fragile TaxID=3417571 RepID=UPI003D345D84|nr:response regulator [Marinilabiliaceae bacterium N1Y90]
MKKAVIIALFSIVFLVLSNIYYYVDTYKWQINTQKDILRKQSLIVGEQLNQYFQKTHTNISLLISENELSDLFSEKGHSIEVQKRLELLFTSYDQHLLALKVFDGNGDVFEMKKGQNQTFISSFDYADINESIVSNIYINPQGSIITYTQPLFNQSKVFGHVEFKMSLDNFFGEIFYNFNLEDFHFQWIMKPNGWVIYNTIEEDAFYPVIDEVQQFISKRNWFYSLHDIHLDYEKVRVLTVFSKLNFNGSDYYLAFSLPLEVITSSIVKNSLVVAAISLFVITLIIVLFSFYIRRQSEDEKSLKKSEEALRKIVYYLPVGVVLFDKSSRIRQVNKAALKLFAFDDEDQLIGRKATDQILFENKTRLQKTSYSSESNKYILTNKNGEESVVLNESIPFYLLREEYQLQVFVEVSNLEKERKTEEIANKAKSTFIANMSHELRTPLNSMIGMTDILMTSDLKSDDRNLLTVVKRSADTLLLLINDILDFSKIEAGRFEIESIPFNLKEEVEQTINMFMPKAEERNLELKWVSEMELPENFIGDPIRFRQVLNNLLSNAIKFTEFGKVILSIKEVRGLNGSPAVSFKLEDTGIGVKKEKLRSIFNSFSQADESITRKYGGTGLGVTISKQLVNLMGGEIGVKSPSDISEHPDYPGAEFSFTLPYRTKTYQKRYNFNHIVALNMVKAFIISDEPLQVRVLMKNLSSMHIDYKILPPSNESIDIIRTDDTHQLLIIDHRPDFNGLAFLQELHNHKLHKRLPIIMQSSDFEPSNTSVAKQLGADVYFRKPVNYSSLKEFILKFFPQVEEKKAILEQHKPNELKVLVAEDNILNQRLAKNLFKKIGHNIDVARNGEDAVIAMKDKRYDIVFMDVFMPGMDGVAAMKEIKKMGLACPVIAMTASVDDADRQVVMDAGMDDFITKPTNVDDLSRMLEKWC